MNKKAKSNKKDEVKIKFPGYPKYPASEDIYNRSEKQEDLDPETKRLKSPNTPPNQPNEVNNMQDMSGEDLDIPGSELDDEQESIGSEDEENNYYSLGGDAHESQEEDKTQ